VNFGMCWDLRVNLVNVTATLARGPSVALPIRYCAIGFDVEVI
jgi:hypothetical protein